MLGYTRIMRRSWTGIILATLYVIVAVIVASQEFNCGGGLDINLCGLGTIVITFPSYAIVGRLFSKIGMAINFHHKPNASDLAQLTVHIAICAGIVYLIGYGLERSVSYFVRRLTRSRTI